MQTSPPPPTPNANTHKSNPSYTFLKIERLFMCQRISKMTHFLFRPLMSPLQHISRPSYMSPWNILYGQSLHLLSCSGRVVLRKMCAPWTWSTVASELCWHHFISGSVKKLRKLNRIKKSRTHSVYMVCLRRPTLPHPRYLFSFSRLPFVFFFFLNHE